MNKNERINEIEAAAILKGAQELLTNVETEIDTVKLHIENAIAKLITGGDGRRWTP